MMNSNLIIPKYPISIMAANPLLSFQQPAFPSPRRKYHAGRARSIIATRHVKLNIRSWKPATTMDVVENRDGEAGSNAEPHLGLSVDIDRVPLFVFFTRRGEQREEFVGMNSASACRKKLRDVLHEITGRTRESLSTTGEHSRQSGDAASIGGPTSIQSSMEVRAGVHDPHNATGTPISDPNARAGGILDVESRSELSRLVMSRGVEDGPVVVMYHAPWCRKCSYLSRSFRVVAQEWEDRVGVGGALADRALFCRVDVSSWNSSKDEGEPSVRNAEATSRGARVKMAEAATVEPAGADRALGSEGSPEKRPGAAQGVYGTDVSLHRGSGAMERCQVCGGSGFLPCWECQGKGAVSRSSPDGKYQLAVICPTCVGYKKLRCDACGGKCYMCD